MTDKLKSPLDNLIIAAPCDVAWDDMVGEGRVRNCAACKMNVFNISEMTTLEAEALLGSEAALAGNLCARLYRRKDGTILTNDCPRGLARVRSVANHAWQTLAASIALLLTSGGVLAQSADKSDGGIRGRVMPVMAGKICPVKPISIPKDQADNPTFNETHGNAHMTALNLYLEGERFQKNKDYTKAADCFHRALKQMASEKHDPKFHLKVETALSKVKAKAGIRQ